MYTANKKNVIVGVVLLALLISIPFTVSQLSKQRETRSRAAASTSLLFSPDSSPSSPIQVNTGDSFTLDIYVDPGSFPVTFVKYQVQFDASKVKLDTSNPFDLNSNIFTNVEGPITGNGTIAESVSIGSDPTKVITTKTKIGTLHFSAIDTTNGGTTPITYTTVSQALSSGTNTQASQNVLSTTTPAYIAINGSGSPSPTTVPTNVPSSSPSSPVSPSIGPSQAPTPTQIPIPTVTGTALNFTLLLHGIGSAGDNPNPTGNSLSNKNPLHQQRNLDVQVLNSNNQVVASISAPIVYDQATGTFMGGAGLPDSFPSGSYNVKVKSERYLRRLIPRIQQIVSGQGTQVETTNMVAGDTNDDNTLNVLDYNALLDCGYGQINPLPMDDPNSAFNSDACKVHTPAENIDLNDDGIINSFDYNLFLRELSVQNGD